jgi:hypothetical protein
MTRDMVDNDAVSDLGATLHHADETKQLSPLHRLLPFASLVERSSSFTEGSKRSEEGQLPLLKRSEGRQLPLLERSEGRQLPLLERSEGRQITLLIPRFNAGFHITVPSLSSVCSSVNDTILVPNEDKMQQDSMQGDTSLWKVTQSQCFYLYPIIGDDAIPSSNVTPEWYSTDFTHADVQIFSIPNISTIKMGYTKTRVDDRLINFLIELVELDNIEKRLLISHSLVD